MDLICDTGSLLALWLCFGYSLGLGHRDPRGCAQSQPMQGERVTRQIAVYLSKICSFHQHWQWRSCSESPIFSALCSWMGKATETPTALLCFRRFARQIVAQSSRHLLQGFPKSMQLPPYGKRINAIDWFCHLAERTPEIRTITGRTRVNRLRPVVCLQRICCIKLYYCIDLTTLLLLRLCKYCSVVAYNKDAAQINI